jgi:hypothetical protein
MLAEIFMVRLEAAVPASQEKLPSSHSQFVPFNLGAQNRRADTTNAASEKLTRVQAE